LNAGVLRERAQARKVVCVVPVKVLKLVSDRGGQAHVAPADLTLAPTLVLGEAAELGGRSSTLVVLKGAILREEGTDVVDRVHPLESLHEQSPKPVTRNLNSPSVDGGRERGRRKTRWAHEDVDPVKL
jgi:hypothetical protein